MAAFERVELLLVKVAGDAELNGRTLQSIMLRLLDAHLAASGAGSHPFASDSVYGDGHGDDHEVAHLADVLDLVVPVGSRFIKDIGNCVPFDIIDRLNVAVAVTPTFTLANQMRVYVLSQFL